MSEEQVTKKRTKKSQVETKVVEETPQTEEEIVAEVTNWLEETTKQPQAPSSRIDWKARINPKHIVLNREAFQKRGISIDDLSDDERENLKQNSDESLLLIKLQGFKDVAYERGYSQAIAKVVNSREDYAVVEYTFHFAPNDENPQGLIVSAIGNANRENVSGGNFASYLEVFAENRALVRAVKNALNISVLGQDELEIEKVEYTLTKKNEASMQNALSQKMDQLGLTFEKVKQQALSKHGEYPGAEKWTSVDSIPQQQAMVILKRLTNKLSSENKE